jgi:trigger factor
VKTTLSEREGNTVKLDVEVSSQELQEAFDAQTKEIAKKVRIPGFRQGKVPLALLRQRVGDEAVLAETIEEYVPRWFLGAVQEVGVDPVDRPQIDFKDDGEPELGKPLAFTATVTVMPEVVLGEYKGLEVPKEPAEVEDSDVNEQMDRLRDQFSELSPAKGRPVQKGDYVTADFSATLDGEPVEAMQASDFAFEVGSSRLFPEIEENVLGMNEGEEKIFNLTLGEGSGDEELAGKTVEFKLAVKEIKEKVMPAVSDQWASEISEFATLLELRQEIRKKIKAAKEYSSDQRFRAMAIQAITDKATLELPDVVVTEQAEEMVQDFKASLEQQGGDLAQYLQATGLTLQQLIADMKPQAAANVKTGLVLDAVAKAEGLDISDQEAGEAVRQMAAAGRVEPEAFESRVRQSGRMQGVKWQLIREKAAEFIVANTVAVAPQEAAGGESAAVPPAEVEAEVPAGTEGAGEAAAKE